jgi:opacity protein-like surface antigen
MKKKTYVVGVAVLLAALLAMSGVAQSEMWIGGQIGGNFPLKSTLELEGPFINALGVPGGAVDLEDVQWRPSVIGGVQIGYNFNNTGFGAYNWPDWMRFFGFAIDFTYNALHAPDQNVNIAINDQTIATGVPLGMRLDGREYCLSFLFNVHYGFFPDSEVPTGRVVPYLAIGPGILFTSLDSGNFGVGRASSTNIALVVEPGIRFMALKNVSIDTALRYRWASPQWEFESPQVAGGTLGDVRVSGLHQLAFLIRANYHF